MCTKNWHGMTPFAVCSLLITSSFFPGISLAQEQGGRYLEETVVTARKREESMQETPVSVTVFNADDLSALAASDISTLGNFTPNLNLAFSQGNSGGSNLSASIRGVGQFDFLITTDPGVGVYTDGVYLGRTSGSVLDLLSVERIEVLRGPRARYSAKIRSAVLSML